MTILFVPKFTFAKGEIDILFSEFNHAYVLQDLETYQAPSTLSYNQNYNKNPHFNQNYNSNNLDVGSYYMAPTSQPTLPTDYSSNPYLAQPAPPALNALPSNQPPMVQPASTTPSYVPQVRGR